MDSRIEQLREWLAEREERVIVIVGHGQFFKRCLNRGFVQANVRVRVRVRFRVRVRVRAGSQAYGSGGANPTPHPNQANVSVLECSFSARSGFTLLAELHPAAEVAAQRVRDGGEGAPAGAQTAAPGGDGATEAETEAATEAARERVRDLSLLPPPPLQDERLDGASGLTEVALSEVTDAAAAAPAVAGAVEAGAEGEAAAGGQGAADGQGTADGAARAGAGAADVAESWWAGASLRALLPSCSVST